MHPVKRAPEFGRVRVVCTVRIGHRLAREAALEVFGEQSVVRGLSSADLRERQAVLREGQMADLPGDVGHAPARLPEPVGRVGVVE
jgi:hypothetical protein